MRFALCLLLVSIGLAQEPREVPLRVTAVQPGGWVGVDRGEQEGLAPGGRVRFDQGGGIFLWGTIDRTQSRTAIVVLDDQQANLTPGTRGVAFVVEGQEPAEPSEKNGSAEAAPGKGDGPAGDGWTEEMPLLARVGAVKPEERPSRWYGRTTIAYDGRLTDADRADGLARNGYELIYENPWGHGGRLHLDGEINVRDTVVPDADGESARELRIDRLSYSRGGTREEPRGFSAGRFLQRVPELGLLDGAEGFQRLPNGDRVGVGLGFLPENDVRLSSGRDLQVSGWYEWNRDASERLSATAAFQQTWHNGTLDRRLFLAKMHYLPTQGWRANAGAWVDFYDENDPGGAGTELTRAYATATRAWESGNGLTLGYTRWRYPEILRDEFPPPAQDQLVIGGDDQISLDGWRWVSDRQRLRGRVSAWSGNGESGGYGELDIEVDELWHDQGQGIVTLFAGSGLYEERRGLRLTYARALDGGRWSLAYELATYSVDGFDATGDEVIQHRLSVDHSVYDLWGWTVSAYASVDYEESESALAVGFHMTRGF